MKTKILSLFVALVATTALRASNVITYTASSKLNGYNSSLSVGKTTFGSAIISHDFSNGTGTITCSGEITTIKEWAFRNCKGLTSITIPNSVTTIESRPFDGCTGLTLPVYNANCFAYMPTSYKDAYAIPDGIKQIAGYAFAYCTCLTSITIPNSVTTIGHSAFEGCSGLTSVTIPNSVTTIGNWAFSDCSSLTSITISDSVTTIEGRIFNRCSNLVSFTIPNSVTTIEEWAFSGCSGLTSVTIPNSVTSIRTGAFEGCSGLKKTNYIGTIADWCKIEFSNGTSNPMRYSHNFFINDVEVKDFVIPEGIEAIGNYAFYNCNSLTSVTIGNSVTTIGNYAFFYCKGLTSITIPNSVTTIGDNAFEGCSGLTSVIIPNSVTTIGTWAFSNSGLTSIVVEHGNTSYDSRNNCNAIIKTASNTLIVGCKTTIIPNSVTMIGDHAFDGSSGLLSVTIPNSVTSIGKGAFVDCSGLTSITCYATAPPTCGSYCFYNVDKSIPVYVPAGSIEDYKKAQQLEYFTDIRPITAQEVEVTEIEAEPTESTVEIAWPIVVDAETYTIEIRLGDQLICFIVFNAQGQLLSINFNPAPGRGHTYATTAEGTATGWAYTIAGLNPGTNYFYSVVAKDATDQVIDTKNGSFTTTAPTGLLDVNDNSKFLIQNSKLIKNGQLYILREGNLFTATGARVK